MPRPSVFDSYQKVQQLIISYREGKTALELAEHWGCSENTITKTLVKNGIVLRGRGPKVTKGVMKNIDGTDHVPSPDGKVDLPWLLSGPYAPTLDERLRSEQWKR